MEGIDNRIFKTDTVTNLRLEIDCAGIRLEHAGDFNEISVEIRNGEQGEFSCLQDGDNLTIRYKMWRNIISRCDTEILVRIPKEKIFDHVWADIGAGSADFYNTRIHCRFLHLEVGAGKILAGSLRVEEWLEVSVGAGSVSFRNTDAANMKVDCGVGQFYMEGQVEKSLTVNCGVGKCEMRLAGRECDYNYDISCGLGKVRVNDSLSCHLGAKQQTRNSGAQGNITLSAGLGKIDLSIA